MDFSGKTALVTGSGSGIGKAIALLLAAHGADIVVNDISADNGAATVKEIEALGRAAVASGANVASQNEVREMFELAQSKFNKVDILVNNAGITRDGFLLKMEEKDWDLVMDVNLKGVFNCCKYGGAMMVERNYGKIVNIASASAKNAFFRSSLLMRRAIRRPSSSIFYRIIFLPTFLNDTLRNAHS